MVIAVIVAVGVMLLAATPLANFIHANPTIVMLALGFLLMIGTMLIADGFGVHVPQGLHLRRDGVLRPGRGPQHAGPPRPPQTRRSESVGHQGEDLTAARSVNAAHLARLRQCEAVSKALTTIRDAATTARGLAIASRSRANPSDG